MTKEEIKQSVSMTEIVERYGLSPNRAGFIRCPFHQGDHTASLKIYKDSFYCFGCGEGGDIFKFVMLMDRVSFKDAFISLGGHYDQPETKSEARHRKRDQLIAEQKRRHKKEDTEQKQRRMASVGRDMNLYKTMLNCWTPFSDEWCSCMEGYMNTLFEYDSLWEEVSEDLWQRSKT